MTNTSLRLAALGALALALGGCGSARPVEFRLDPPSYVTFGYTLGTKSGVDLIVEDIRYQPKFQGTVVIDLCVINRRPRPVWIDLRRATLSVGDRDLIPRDEAPTLQVAPSNLQRATMHFRTDMGAGQLLRGSAKIDGIRLDDQTPLSFEFSFYQVTDEELAREAEERE